MSKDEKLDEGYMLSNVDIDRMFMSKYFNKPLKTYGGIYMHDELLDKTPEHGKFYVINLDKKNGEGTHWVLVFNVFNNVVYFDSFACHPSDIITGFMKRAKGSKGKKKTIFYNTVQIQNPESVNCGFFVVFVAKELLKRKSIVNVLANFNLNFKTWLNEYLIEQIKRTELFNTL